MAKAFNPTIDFTDSPTLCRFIEDGEKIIDSDEQLLTPHFVRAIYGPFGSGKSTACSAVTMQQAMIQDIDPRTEIRRSRHAIIRNTQPELKSTTIKTWTERWPEEACGPLRYSAPITHHIIRPPRHGKPGIDAEFLFIALDQPKDVAKLRSLDLTDAWVNEADALSPALISMLTGRVGRFPPKERLGDVLIQARRPCIVMDTNMPDEDNYLLKIKAQRPFNWTFYQQPPAVLECERRGNNKAVSIEPGWPAEVDAKYVIDAQGKCWIVNPAAENLTHLRGGYYPNQIAGKSLQEIQRYLQTKSVFVRAGKPVVPNFREETHVHDNLPVWPDQTVYIGTDIGGGTLSPATCLAQRGPRGNWLIQREVVAEDMGVDSFCGAIIAKLIETYGKIPELRAWGDPAGVGRDEIYETVVFDHMRKKGIPIQPAQSNVPDVRIQAIVHAMDKMIDGKAYVLIDRRCVQLRKALAGGWHYKRMNLLNEDRYHETPNKNHPDSDIGDALGYLFLGAGEVQDLRRAGHVTSRSQAPVVMSTDFDIFKS